MKRIGYIVLAVFSIIVSSCDNKEDDQIQTSASNNEVYELDEVNFYSNKDDFTDTLKCQMDTTIIYNYSESNSKDVLFSPNFNDTLSLTITEGKEYLSDLKLQGEIKYPSSYDNQQFYFNTDGKLKMPIGTQDSVFCSPEKYTLSTILHPRSYLVHTGTYFQIINHYSFQAVFIGKNTHKLIYIKGKYRYSRSTFQSFNGSKSSETTVSPIE